MSYVGPSSSAPGSTTKIKVSISPVGEITGDNKNQFTSFLGNVVRTHCPIAYKDWRLVPDTIKDNVWSTILAKYDVDDSDSCKTAIIKRANDMWKDWKNRLRGTVLDMYDNDGDRKKNCPNGVKLEDWVKFVDYESTKEAKSRRGKGKESRSEMKFPHTTGRRGSVRTAELIAFFRSGDTSSHRDESAPPPLLRVEQICHLTDICSRVVARGRLIRDNAGIPPDCIKVILDVVEVPSANVFGDIEKTLADCDVGDVLVWPRVLTKT
ncbi:uncharacterized protein LOC131257520 [Magnolia sinica]|uniref:uncharacterized protein LOC131257520 n=1 Tax=Magnolia sinica TaxID=86752 RepID=UPI00265A9255|nr:uncharacterized protein LOC131257520 [Magnolia sinica]